MGNNKKYLSTGLFVLGGFVVIIAILLWFSESSRQTYNNYTVVFHEAVDGLSTSSIVKLNGVEVGKVSSITIDDKDLDNIVVNIKVLSNIPLTTATYGTVKSQGITGMSYVSLAVDQTLKGTKIEPHNKMPYPVLNSRTSLLTTITDQAQKIGNNISDISTDLKHLLNESNIEHVNHIVSNIDVMTTAVASQSRSIESSLYMVAQVLHHVNENTENLNVAIVKMSQLSTSLESNSAQLGLILETVQNDTLASINTILLPNLNQSVSNMSSITLQFNDLLRTVNNNPSVFVRGTAPAEPGPKE